MIFHICHCTLFIFTLYYPACPPFFMLNKISLCGYIYHIFFIHSSIGGPLGWFHVIAVVNSTAISMGVRGGVVCMNSVTCTSRHVVTRHIWARSLVFWKQFTPISVAAAAVCAPTLSVQPTSSSDLILILSFGLIATATGARWNIRGRTVIFFSNEQQLHAHVEAGGQSQVSFLRRRRDECVLEAGFLTGSLVDQCISKIHLSPPRQPWITSTNHHCGLWCF